MPNSLLEQLQATLGSSFAIVRELGGGGMSRVFLAADSTLDRQVVIKVLSPELAEGLSSERFMREIRVAASLQQANIVPVLFTGSTGNLPYYAMPYVEGESLRHLLASGPLAVAEVVSVLRDVSRALGYAHSRGVMHRDIKPDNVLLSSGAAVVTDFGIAKAITAARAEAASATLTQIGTSIGTPAYMAPEQAAGDPNVDHRADLYSLGCMAFELLAGRQVFSDRTAQRVLAAHMTESPPDIAALRTDCPPQLAALLRSLLAKDPGQRPQTAQDVLLALDAVSSGRSTSMPASLRYSRHSLWKVLAIYAAAFVALIVFAKAAVVGVGLPEWVIPGTIVVMALGLPAILVTWYVLRVTRRAAVATPTLTPGGTAHTAHTHGTMATMALKASPHVSWRRTIRGGYVAVGTFALLVVAVMIMRVLGIGPAKTLFAAGTLHRDDRILISGFTVTPASDSAFSPILTEGVTNALGQSRAVRLVSPSEVARALRQMKRNDGAVLTDSIAREVAERAGARAIVSGKIARTGNAYAVSLSLRTSADGAVLASFQEIADTPKELIEVVDALTRKLRGKMGESLRTVNQSVPLEQATTSSLEALRKYSEGTRANDVDADFERAVRTLREAVALDSTFAVAWRKLGLALANGRYSALASDSAFRNGARYADKLPDRERGLVLGAYYASADRDKAIAAYESAYAADSFNMPAMNQLMNLARARHDYERALHFAKRAVAVSPDESRRAFVAYVYTEMGKPDRAQLVLDSLLREDSAATNNSFVMQALRATVFARSRFDTLEAIGEFMRKAASPTVRVEGLRTLAQLALLQGRLTESRRQWRALDAAQHAMNVETFVLDTLRDAWIDVVFRNRPDDAARRLAQLTSQSQYVHVNPEERGEIQVAWIHAMRGDNAASRAALTRVSRASLGVGRDIIFSRDLVEGLIAANERHYPEAITKLRLSDHDSAGVPQGCLVCTELIRAKVYEMAQQPDSAIAALERYLAAQPAANNVFEVNEWFARALVYKRLGELYAARGNPKQAADNLTRFVSLWSHADAELMPAVDSARRQLAGLARR